MGSWLIRHLPRTLPLSRVAIWSLGAILTVGLLDFATGVEVRVHPLYFIPVAFTAWYAPFWSLLTAAASGMTWVVSNLLAGHNYSSGVVWAINFVTQTVAFVCVALLITGLRQRLEHEEALSRSDPLTSLPNSRAFYERAELLIAQARRQRQTTTLAYLDLDHFKTVNDMYGHQQGDEVLRELASILKRHTRASDLIARLGGDEFVVLFPNTSPDGAKILLERLRILMSEAMCRKEWPVTVSIGAVSFVSPPANLDDAVRRADALMYAAKEDGRNQVHHEIVGTAEDPAPTAYAFSGR